MPSFRSFSIVSLLLLAVLAFSWLAACGAPAQVPTAAPTVAPAPTAAPTFDPTALLEADPYPGEDPDGDVIEEQAVDLSAAAEGVVEADKLVMDPFNFEAQELAGFEMFVEKMVDGARVIVGVDSQGAEKVLAMELELANGESRMVRVSTVEVEGVNMAVYLNPDYDVGDENRPWRVKLRDEAAEVFLLGDNGLLVNLNGKLGQYPGEAGRAEVMDAIKNGTPIDIARLEQPDDWVANPVVKPGSNPTLQMQWGMLKGVRLDKPIEIVLIDSDEALARMPKDIQERVVHMRNQVNPDGSVFKSGYLLSKGKDGHLIVVGLNNMIGKDIKRLGKLSLRTLSLNISRNVFMANIMLGMYNKPDPFGRGEKHYDYVDIYVEEKAIGITDQDRAFAFQE